MSTPSNPRADAARTPSSAMSLDGAGSGATTAPGPGERWYRRLVEQSPDGICVYEAGRVVYVNAAGARLFGARCGEDLIGRPITEFVTVDSLRQMVADLAELKHPGDSTPQFQADLIREDGKLLAVEVVAVKLSWEGTDALQVITRDVSARTAAEAALKYQAALVNHVSDAIIGTTADGQVTSWNPAAQSIYGRSAAEAIGLPVATVVGAALHPAAVVASGGVVAGRHRSSDGQPLDVRISAAAMSDGYVLVCSDQTELHRAKQHFEAVVTSMSEGLIVTDENGLIKSINPAGLRILGATDDADLIGIDFFGATDGRPFYDEDGANIAPEDRPARAVLRSGIPFEHFVYGWDHLDGRVWLTSSCRLLDPEKPGQSDMMLTFTDITAQRAEAQELKFLATHDGLTSLPNRAAMRRRINEALCEPSSAVRLCAVLFIDVDRLKTTNDTHGHEAGDLVLRTIAERLRRTVDASDAVGRWGGDEFVVLICRSISPPELDDLVGRLLSALSVPAAIGATSVPMSASIGFVEVHPAEQRTADDILRDADQAMYRAKRAPR